MPETTGLPHEKKDAAVIPEHYFNLVDMIPNAAYIKDLNGGFVYCNKAFGIFLHLPRTAIVGKTAVDLHTRTMAAKCRALDENLLLHRLTGHFEIAFDRTDGSSVKADVLKTAVCDGWGKNAGVLGILADTSQRRRHNTSLYRRLKEELETSRTLEAELTAKNADLAAMVDRLRETQFQMAQQEKFVGIGQMAAGVAHEINNPLGFVLSNFEMLETYVAKLVEMIDAYRNLHRLTAAGGDDAWRREADRIGILENRNRIDYIIADLKPLFSETTDGINRVSEIVKALRLFSRIDQQDGYERYDLNDGIRSTLAMARNEIKQVARVEEDLGDIPLIEASGGRVNQVLLNIVLNAVQAIAARRNEAEGVIKIRSYRDGSFVCCTVEDNGTGIPEDVKQDIFNPFFTTKPLGHGTGLGLSISYEIVVNKHHGELGVADRAGGGTVFTVKLPVRQPA